MQLLHRAPAPASGKAGLGLLFIMILLGAFLALQVGLMVWVYLKQWL